MVAVLSSFDLVLSSHACIPGKTCIDMHLPALSPEKIRPRIPPQWERLLVSSLILVPVFTARHLLWRFLSATFDNYFLNNCAAYPFGFCGGLTFLFEILNQSNCQEAFSYSGVCILKLSTFLIVVVVVQW